MTIVYRKEWGLLILVAALLLGYGCKKDSIITDPSAKLNFSADTLVFDTVFTMNGGGPEPRSVNKRFIVYNPHNESIKTSIWIGGGNASPFRINIDGHAVSHIEDYEIMPKDSIYVFAEVTIDGGNPSNPFFVKDSIVFRTNGNIQDVKLVAWGQDAHYFKDSVLDCNIIWGDVTKPYVIYQSVLVPQGCKLTINPGVKVYSDVGSLIYVAGTLEVKGTKDNTVVLQGARLGAAFEQVPGQWGGIHLLTTSKDNSIEFAEIKNAMVGLRVDSLSSNGQAKVKMKNTVIKNMSAVGVLGYTARLEMENCEVSNCGRFTFALDLGGDAKLNHCTFANLGGDFARRDAGFLLSNADYVDPNNVSHSNSLAFLVTNSIIWGDLDEEMVIYTEGLGAVNGVFDFNILKTEITGFLPSNKLNTDPKFKDIEQGNFELDTLSPAINAATGSTMTIDLKGNPRLGVPDLGAYERE